MRSPAATVLVVDDTPENIELLDGILSTQYRVKVATNGERTLQIARSDEPPHLILLDVMMPGMDGYEVCRKLKEDPRTRRIPVIFITARSDMEDERRGLQVGAVDYITKPISPPIVEARVATHLALVDQRIALESNVRERTLELTDALDALERERREHASATARADYLLSFDTVTGVANRHDFVMRLERTADRVRRAKQRLALVSINLDRFHMVNAAHGEQFGDRLLRAVAQRLGQCIRATDLLARIGPDEFVTLLSEDERLSGDDLPSAAAELGERMLAAVRRPFELRDTGVAGPIEVTASGGVTLFPDDGDEPLGLIKRLQAATIHSKSSGRDQISRYSPTLDANLGHQLQLEQRLRDALRNRVLEVYFQPKIRVSDRHISGAEALVRWPDGQGGFISPSEFVPLAEDTGLVVALDRYVLETVVSNASLWRAVAPYGVRIAVNLSAASFGSRDLLQVTRQVLDAAPEPVCLEFELTEHTLLGDVQSVIHRLHALREMGVTLALDDFGTGYSSLAYLKRLPFDVLKVDQSFVRDIETDAEDRAIVGAILALAKRLDFKTVAEGVATTRQFEFVESHGCDEVQGFLFSPALPGGEFMALLGKPAVPA